MIDKLKPFDSIQIPVDLDPNQFMEFLTGNVDIERLLQDRPAQSSLARIINEHFRFHEDLVAEAQKEGKTIIKNLYHPIVFLLKDHETGKPLRARKRTRIFMLKDQEFYYYFDSEFEQPYGMVPPYLRPEDVVPSGIKKKLITESGISRALKDLRINREEFLGRLQEDDGFQMNMLEKYGELVELPFNRTINRVLTQGGNAERYNYVVQAWEENQDGRYEGEQLLINEASSMKLEKGNTQIE